MSKQTYWQKLKDPRWQKRRLSVMEKAKFCCQKCHRDDQTLNVHHLYYMSKREPWDYPDFALQCICEECHAQDHEEERENGTSNFEMVINWMVGNDFENEFFFEIANQIREVRDNKLIDPDFYLDKCMRSISNIRIKYEKLAKQAK